MQDVALHSDGLQPLSHASVGDPVGATQAGQAKGYPVGCGGDPSVALDGRCRAFLKLGLGLRACAAGLQAGRLTQRLSGLCGLARPLSLNPFPGLLPGNSHGAGGQSCSTDRPGDKRQPWRSRQKGPPARLHCSGQLWATDGGRLRHED